MFHPRQIQVILVLFTAANCVVCLTNRLDSFNNQRSAQIDTVGETRFWESGPQFSSISDTLDDRLDYLVSGSNQALRGSLIKAANNQQHIGSLQRSSPFTSQVSEVSQQTNANSGPTRELIEPFYPQRLRQDKAQLQTQGSHSNHRHHTSVLSSQQTVEVREVSNRNTTRLGSPELASSLVSGDEVLSQSTTAIEANSQKAQHDWPTHAPNGGGHASEFGKSSRKQDASIGQTRPNVKVSIDDKNDTDHHQEPLVLDHGKSLPNIADHYYDRELLPQQRELGPSATNVGAASSSIEFNNQVIYEGPVTPPPSTTDNYYPTSSERPLNNNNNHHNEQDDSNSWWAIGVGDEFDRVNNLTQDSYLAYCNKTPFLTSSKQRSLCRLHPRVMSIVARAIRMAIEECQKRFAHSRWNCSIIMNGYNHQNLDPSINSGGQDHDPDLVQGATQIFGDVMRYPNRERSFLNALSAAALAHAITKACRQGELSSECGCDRRVRSTHRGHIEWVGCSDDIDYGAKFSRDFTDNFDNNEPDATKTIYLHNSEVGRRVFKTITDITCNCLNGGDGLCATKRCWRQVGAFADVVDQIMERYESATHVQRSNRDPQKLRPVRRGVRRPNRKDLVYGIESPNYCQRDLRIGVLGTENRICNSTSQGSDSCSHLCCGRGFERVVEHVEEDCNCKFVWCCHVECDRCSRLKTNDICN